MKRLTALLLYIGFFFFFPLHAEDIRNANQEKVETSNTQLSDVQTINKEIQQLTEILTKYRARANEEQREAQRFLLADWLKYTKEMQQYEHDENVVEKIETRLIDLQKQKQRLLSNETTSKNSH